MTRIAFVAVGIMVAAMGSAFAGSDHYGAGDAGQPMTGVDRTITGSVPMKDADHRQFQSPASSGDSVAHLVARHNDDGLWGR